MEFSKIVSIAGKPGLYKVVSQTKTGFIVESFVDQKRFPISSTKNISLLENIAIYTYTEEVALQEVFKSIFKKENGEKAISHKESGTKLASYFAEVLPDYDAEKVYTSNIKKVLQWYNILIEASFDFSEVEEQQPEKENKTV